jgi:hypothetical protein
MVNNKWVLVELLWLYWSSQQWPPLPCFSSRSKSKTQISQAQSSLHRTGSPSVLGPQPQSPSSHSSPLDTQKLTAVLKEAKVVSSRVSSFLTSPEKIGLLLSELAAVADQEAASPAELLEMIEKGDRDLVVTVAHGRRLEEVKQTTNGTNSTTPAESQIFKDMTPFALSGLWVGLFLIVMLCIGVSCLLDLKTNDRFARQNLWVGRES